MPTSSPGLPGRVSWLTADPRCLLMRVLGSSDLVHSSEDPGSVSGLRPWLLGTLGVSISRWKVCLA